MCASHPQCKKALEASNKALNEGAVIQVQVRHRNLLVAQRRQSKSLRGRSAALSGTCITTPPATPGPADLLHALCCEPGLQSYVVNEVRGEQTVIITGLQVLQQGDGAAPAAAAASDAAGSKPDQQATPTAAKQPPSTPAAAAGGTRSLLGTPGPAPSPSEE